MNATIDGWLAGASWAGILALVLDISIKAAIVCAVAGVATMLMRRWSAGARSMVWVFTLAALLALPLTHFISPVWNLPVLPEVGSWFREGASTGAAISGEKIIDPETGAEAAATRGAAADAAKAPRFTEGWHAWAFLVWMAGTAMSLLWLAVRTSLGSRILRRCDAADETWNALLERVSTELGLNRRVRLFESCEIGAAVTIGAINPAIVVPAGSSEWPVARRRYILSHELAHVKRRDGLIEVLALVVKSIYWFNPLVWLAVRAARVERERDCDDAVLNSGARPSDYAMFLMDVAADLGAPRGPAWQLSTISQGSHLKERIMSILDPKIDRNRGRRRAGVVSCFLVASIVLPLSISGIWQTQAQEKPHKSKEKALQYKQQEQKQKEIEFKKMQKEKMAGMSSEETIAMKWEQIAAQEGSAAVLIHDAIEEKGPEAGMKLAMKLKESGDDEYYFKEGEFNTLGYYFLYGDKLDEAIAVFKINVRMNPDSWNVYDSLGEAVLAAGKYESARKYYEKSLELNPENENGRKMLAKLEAKEEGLAKSHKSVETDESD